MDYCLLCKNSLHLTNKIKKIWSVRLLQISNNVLYKTFSFDEVLVYEYIELFKFCIHYNTSLDVPSQVFIQYWFFVKDWYIEVKTIDISIYNIWDTICIIRINSFQQILHTGTKFFPNICIIHILALKVRYQQYCSVLNI